MEEVDQTPELQAPEQLTPAEPITKTAPAPPDINSNKVKLTEWEIDNQVPCGVCDTWIRKSNIARHCKGTHYIEVVEMFRNYYEDVAELYIKRIGEK